MGRSCDLRTIYEYALLHENSEHVKKTDDGEYKYIHVKNCKKRKSRDYGDSEAMKRSQVQSVVSKQFIF